MTLHNPITITFITAIILAFITGYMLCLYNSTDDFLKHGLEEDEDYHRESRIQPRPEVELVEVNSKGGEKE